MNKLRKIAVAVAALVLLSCTEKNELVCLNDADIYVPATVSLELGTSTMEQGRPGTKVVDDPDDYRMTMVRNISILQYDGTDDNAKLVGSVHYYRDDADPGSDEYLDYSKIKLVDSAGKDNTIVILANMFTPMQRIGTLGQMLALTRVCYEECDLFGHEGQDRDIREDGTEFYQHMFAIAVSPVSDGAAIKAVLKRSFAHLKIRIENKGDDGVQINSIQLRNVPITNYYITDYNYIGADGNGHLLREQFHDNLNPTRPFNRDFPALRVESASETQTIELDYYVTCNQRGTINNDIPRLKGVLRPNDAVTYLEIFAHYGSDHDQPVYYRFYLGANLTDDFNINPNTVYEYKFTIEGKGNSESEKRLQDWSGQDFDVDANCYMLTPPLEGESYYSFNVVHRPNLFWGDRYGLHSQEKYKNNYISLDENWHVRIIWSDIPLTAEEASAFLVVHEGTGDGGYFDDSQRVVVRVPSGMENGNILVGIYTDDPDNVLWSWHLWITDYCPDRISGTEPVEGRFIYSVPGGEVHRYNNKYWTAAYGHENAYAMDRFLGSTNQTGAKLKYYQYGRKDPFVPSGSLYSYNPENFEMTSLGGNRIKYIKRADVDKQYSTGGRNIPFTISHPMHFIHTSAWTTHDGLGNGTTYWEDPSTGVRTEHEEQFKKSLFDPCPPGWTVMFENAFADFNGTSRYTEATDPKVNFQWNSDPYGRHSSVQGRTYFPLGYLNDKDNIQMAQAIYFPNRGYIETSLRTGDVDMDRSPVGVWMVKDGNLDSGLALKYSGTKWFQEPVNARGTGSIQIGFYVRCVRVN